MEHGDIMHIRPCALKRQVPWPFPNYLNKLFGVYKASKLALNSVNCLTCS